MASVRFAAFGAGFWARPQLAAWRELPGVECVALYNRTRARAEKLASHLGIPAVYDDPRELLRREQLDFVDVITGPESHEELVSLVASRRLPVICQKPMALSLASAERMVAACAQAGVPFFVHENWRWQGAIRQVKRALDEGSIGRPFRARLEMVTGAPVFVNQPFLKDLERFLLTDMGSHLLDVTRFLFGEAASLYALADRVHRDIKGEDVATVMLRMRSGTTVVVLMGFPENHLEREKFPETFIFIEGEAGTIELAADYSVRVTTAEGTHSRRYPPLVYPWADRDYALSQGSCVPCNADLLRGIKGEGRAETTGADNLETVRLVFAAYDSAEQGKVIQF